MEKLRIYLNGLSAQEKLLFSDAIQTSIGFLRKAISINQLLSPLTCVRIEKSSKGKVSRKDLRPNDWQEYWPELKKTNRNVS